MKIISTLLLTVALFTLLYTTALAQDTHGTTASAQSTASSLANLPDADVLIYLSPQRILNEAAPKFMPAPELAKMRAQFEEMKKSAGVDPSAIEYLVIALRFHKPAGDLSFTGPDIMAVAVGDFSADSFFTLAQLYLQDKGRMEKRGSKTIAVMKVDSIATEAEKTPMLKSLVEMGLVPLSANSIAVGNLRYLESAVDAAESGTGRINPATLQSLMRDPTVLVAATGAPLTAFAKAFGLYGTETTPRNHCDMPFGNFYSAITLNGRNLSLRGAMNADNADTAKIISGLLAGLMQQGIKSVPDKQAQSILQTIKLTPQEDEIVLQADVPDTVIADMFAPKPATPTSAIKPATVKTTSPRRPIRKKRPRQ